MSFDADNLQEQLQLLLSDPIVEAMVDPIVAAYLEVGPAAAASQICDLLDSVMPTVQDHSKAVLTVATKLCEDLLLPATVQLLQTDARIHRIALDAYVDAGFSREEAMDLLVRTSSRFRSIVQQSTRSAA